MQGIAFCRFDDLGRALLVDRRSGRAADEINRAVGSLVETAEQIRADGIPVEIVSAGGTATYLTTSRHRRCHRDPGWRRHFGDIEYLQQGANVKRALSLMCQVTSRPTAERVIRTPAARPSTQQPQPEPRGISLSTDRSRFRPSTAPSILAQPSADPRYRGSHLLQRRLFRPVQSPAREFLWRPQRCAGNASGRSRSREAAVASQAPARLHWTRRTVQ